jgi:hypothetical protein
MRNGVRLRISAQVGLIYDKNRGSKISCQCPFRDNKYTL